jgi:hypothetical protein
MSRTSTPSPDAPEPEPWGWTRTHQIGIAMLLAMTLLFFGVIYHRNPARLDDSVVVVDGRRVELEQQIDPNTADWPSLARLPHIGESLARRLVEYRQSNAGASPGGVAFHTLEDLDKVGGFGPKTREVLRPYLKFPAQPVPAPVPGAAATLNGPATLP